MARLTFQDKVIVRPSVKVTLPEKVLEDGRMSRRIQ